MDMMVQRLCGMIHRYEKELLRLCCVMLQDAALAQDAVQETFFKAYRGLSRFKGDCSEKTWLIRIAINTCRDMQRSAWHRHTDRHVIFSDLITPVAPVDEAHIALMDALLSLPRKEREAVLLHHYHGLTQKETAQALGITQPAVALRLKHAYAHLRHALEGDDSQ